MLRPATRLLLRTVLVDVWMAGLSQSKYSATVRPQNRNTINYFGKSYKDVRNYKDPFAHENKANAEILS
jgi:hypothetical protein